MRPTLTRRDPRPLLALVVGGLGVADLVLAAWAPRWEPAIVPPLIALGAGLAGVLSGLALLLLAAGLSRGVRVAWLFALALLAAATLGARHDAWALATLLPAVALWAQRAAFTAPARRPWSGGAILLAGLALLLLPGLGGLAGPGGHQAGMIHAHGFPFVHVAHAAAASTHTHSTFARHRPPPITLLAGIGALALLAGLGGFARPGQPRPIPGDRDRDRRDMARRLFDAQGANGVGYFAPMDDKTVWADPNGEGIVAFRVIGATALVAGDPIARPEELPRVLDHFLVHCHRHGWTPAFYQTLGAGLPHYRAHGFRALAIGREAVIDLPSFTLSGKRIANVRHSVTHAERAGLQVRVYPASEIDVDLRTELLSVSREWLAGKGGGEMGFTMGQLSETGDPTPGARVAVARDATGRAQAFITLVPAGGGRGWTLDLMRRRQDTASGTMDLLIARAAEALRDEGYRTFSLSLAPMASSVEDDEDAPAPARRARALLYARMAGAYNYRSLFRYKDKFAVRWETRYLVYAGNAALPAALYATARAHMPAALIPMPDVRDLARRGQTAVRRSLGWRREVA